MISRGRHPGPIGVDIGATSVRMLQLADASGQLALQAAAYYDLSEVAVDAQRRNAVVRDAIQDAVRNQPFVGRNVAAALGTGEFQMKNLRLPKMPESDLASALEFEVQDRFDLGGRAAQFRHLPAGEVRHGNEIKDEVIVFAAPDETVNERLTMLESLKLRPISLDVAPCAVARSFARFLRRAEDVHAINVFVDVGWRGTTIVITHGTKLAFLKMLDVGGERFTAAVAKTLSLPPQQALQLRIRRMHAACDRRNSDPLTVPAEIDAAVTDALRPSVDRMLKEIQLCLRYFAVTFRGQRPECLTFVGGEASEPSLVKIIGDEIDVPCLIGHPLRGIGNLGAMGHRDQRTVQPAWAVACGLALRGTSWVQPADAAGQPSVAAVA